jgi:hypothetical protein
MSTIPGDVKSLDARTELLRRCDVIEETYEFLLAYAAQGLPGDHGSQSGGQLREFLRRSTAAVSGLAEVFASIVDQESLSPRDRYLAVLRVVERDAEDSLALLELVAAQPSISSQLIDNLNASIHIRALLTDLFVIDEILKGHQRASGPASA